MILGIDYGLRNIGLSLSDNDEKVAAAYKTLSNKLLLENISRIINDKNISKVVFGYPTKGNGEEGFVAQMMKSFIDNLKDKHPYLHVFLMDESMTTVMAKENLRKLGYSSKSVEEMKDQEAARIILQEYIDSVNK